MTTDGIMDIATCGANNLQFFKRLNNGGFQVPPSTTTQIMGNHTTSEKLQAEDEPPLHIDKHSYEIRSVITDRHQQQLDALGRPVLIFDRWKILQSDMKHKRDYSSPIYEGYEMDADNEGKIMESDTSGGSNDDATASTCTTDTPITTTITTTNATTMRIHSNDAIEGTQKNQPIDSIKSKNSISRPSSLAIISLTNDLHADSMHEVGSYKEVQREATSTNDISTARYIRSIEPGLSAQNRSASADPLLETRPGLQQRRNKRPTSLQIPSLLNLPPPPVNTAHPFSSSSQDFSFTGHSPIARQRSYSMPSNTFIPYNEQPVSQKHTLHEAVNLLNKKKLTRGEIDEQTLLHRAADAGNIKLVKKCISAGCSINKKLDSLNGISALHCAVRADIKSEEITSLLLQNGIDVNAENDLGETAIFSAIIHNNLKCIDLLIEHGCDINAVWQQSTPMYLMLVNKNTDACRNLLIKGAQVTRLAEDIRQPFHAVLNFCHTQPINQELVNLLKLMVQADGNVVQHLLNYCGRSPGQSEQDIIYHIYRMPNGPAQDEGKKVIRSLVKLGYNPSRGELSTMSQQDTDYDYIYSYIKAGPRPLKDLCVKAIRCNLRCNVLYAVERWQQLADKEKSQLLLLPPPPPEHEYENVVLRRDKEERKSRKKSLKNLVSGFARLSKRFNKKDSELKVMPGKEGIPGSNSPQLSGLAKEIKGKSGSLPSALNGRTPPPVKPKPNPKPKYLKKEFKKPDLKDVKDIIKQYSTSETSLHSQVSKDKASQENIASSSLDSRLDEEVQGINPEATNGHGNSHLAIKNSDNSEGFTAAFNPAVRSLDRNHKFLGPQLTPMKDHAPVITSDLSLKTSGNADNC